MQTKKSSITSIQKNGINKYFDCNYKILSTNYTIDINFGKKIKKIKIEINKIVIINM